MTPPISDKAFNLIVGYEVTSQAYYLAHLSRPTWPGVSSGVTIGIGFDLGYTTVRELLDDWGVYIAADDIARLKLSVGVKGRAAQPLAAHLHDISVSWDAAIAVFRNKDVVKFTNLTLISLPAASKLNGDCLGALVSLVFNRGASFNLIGDHYREMQGIRAAAARGTWGEVPDLLRQMKRLWPLGTEDGRGLQNRREAEAVLFQEGLDAQNAVA